MKKEMVIPALSMLMLVTSCATTPETQTVADRHGVISIDLPSLWLDQTATYLRERDEVSKFGKLKTDAGIRFLFYLVAQNNEAQCSMRELTYSNGEVGYYWSLENLASEIAKVKDKDLESSGMNEYLQMGIPVPLGRKGHFLSKTSKTEIVSSNQRQFPNQKRFEARDGWETVRNHPYQNKNAVGVSAISWTDVTEFPMKEDRKRVFFVSECISTGFPETEARRKVEVTALLQTIKLLY
ncbi:hypothetical protein [Methylophilus sp.]|uniref:hypothetical protein n=1 Tax=Methylophilus sp. TaxID=29541 RepID=UPI004036A269